MFNSNSLAISNSDPDLKALSRVGSRADSRIRFLISIGVSQSFDLITFLIILTMLAA